MRTTNSMFKRQVLPTVVVVAGALTCSSAFADPEGAVPSAADETTLSLSTVRSIDRVTGGYKGWGPIANLQTPYAASENGRNDFAQESADRAAQFAVVKQARDSVWLANAPLRAPQNVGVTGAETAGGMGRFDPSGQR